MKLSALTVVFLACLLAGWQSGGNPQAATAPEESGPARPGRLARGPIIPADVRFRVQTIRRSRDPGERLRQVVFLASNLPLADFPRWYDGNFLEFLDGGLEVVFYQVLTERWAEADPEGAARWLLEHGKASANRALECWVRVDETAAVAYVKAMPAARREKAVTVLVESVGERSVPAALTLLDQLRTPSLYVSNLLVSLAKLDREAVCGYANSGSDAARLSLLTAAAGAWVEQDLRWVVTMMQQEGLGPEILGQIANTTGYGTTGLAVLNQAALLPTGWLENMGRDDRRLLTLGSEVAWLGLKTAKPGLTEEVLREFQLQAAQTPWWYNDQRDAGLKLVAEGDWLPMEARAKIAETLALRWKDDPAAAGQWVDTLQGDLRTAAEKGLQQMLDETDKAHGVAQFATLNDAMRALVDGSITTFPRIAAGWGATATDEAVRLAGDLAPELAEGLSKSLPGGMPRSLQAAIISRALSAPITDEDNRAATERSRDKALYGIAANWAATDPQQAAAWVTTLAPGEARVWAAKNVALQWNQYSSTEVRAWAATLPDEERQSVIAVLKQALKK